MSPAQKQEAKVGGRRVRWMLAVLLAGWLLPDMASAEAGRIATGDPAAALQREYRSLLPVLAKNHFGRPLDLQSEEGGSQLKGDIHARLDHPYSEVQSALTKPEGWCEVLILHLNVKYCRVLAKGEPQGGPGELLVKAGKKEFEPLEKSHTAIFRFRLLQSSPGYFEAELNAPEGPIGTRDYRVTLSAIPVSATQTFIHLRYGYGFGAMGNMAMSAYLAGPGRNKRGFTPDGQNEDGKPDFIRGPRSIVERNCMRYYLAIAAYLDSLRLPPMGRQEARLEQWFDSTEEYALQLHEMSRAEYLNIKQRELARQQQVPPESLRE
jgi:hypothetical protein